LEREEHEEEEVANAGPSENVSQPTRQANPTPEPRTVGKREKPHRAIERIKTAGWIFYCCIIIGVDWNFERPAI